MTSEATVRRRASSFVSSLAAIADRAHPRNRPMRALGRCDPRTPWPLRLWKKRPPPRDGLLH